MPTHAGRAATSAVAVSPAAAGGAALPAVTYSYDPATGLPTTVTAGGSTLTTSYDTLGRVSSYTDATGAVATSSYDLDGQLISRTDSAGTTTWTYDSSSEHRGLVTGEDLHAAAGQPSVFTAVYDAAGTMSQSYPNGLTATTSVDNAGNPLALTYAKGGVTWTSFTATVGVGGRTVGQSSPQSGQVFAFDGAGRLTTVADTYSSACSTRVYGFDTDSNRTSLASYPAGTGGVCSTGTTPVTVSGSFDGADRITSTGYSYDTLGRTTTVPAVDASGIGSHAGTTGAVTVGYYANDMAASQTQGGESVSFTLDPAQNRIASQSDNGTVTVNHYDDGTDSPAYTSSTAGMVRNVPGIDGTLAATIDPAGTVTLQLANLHGDLVATAPDDPAATGIASYSESTEYGTPRVAAAAPDSYGWLGAHQRSTNDLAGLTLMGVRLYNPTTGRFLTTDPIPGGNDNAYTYPTDPINKLDPTGKWCLLGHNPNGSCRGSGVWNKIWNWVKNRWHTIQHYGLRCFVGGAAGATRGGGWYGAAVWCVSSVAASEV